MERLVDWDDNDDGWSVDEYAIDWSVDEYAIDWSIACDDGCLNEGCKTWCSMIIWLLSSSSLSFVRINVLSFRERFARLHALFVFAGAIYTLD